MRKNDAGTMSQLRVSALRSFAALIALLAVCQAVAAPADMDSRQVRHKFLVDAYETATLAHLAEAGATKLADYGAFTLWSIPEPSKNALSALRGTQLRDDFDRISLRGGLTIDARVGEPDVPSALRQASTPGPSFRMVQFVGPVQETWLKALTDMGLEVVTYMPQNAYVVWGASTDLAKLEAAAGQDAHVQWTGAFHPAYRLAPALLKRAELGPASVAVTVQVYATPATERTLARLRTLGGTVIQAPARTLGFTNVSLYVPANKLVEIATWPDVFNVEAWYPSTLLDEVQGQIVAGNVVSMTPGDELIPIGPNYLGWLASKGFPTDPSAYPIVDIVDDGLDSGDANNLLHPDFHEFGDLSEPDRVSYINNCTAEGGGYGILGHGNGNAAVVGGYNDLLGYPYEDADGYQRGLGVSPYGRIASTKTFRSDAGPGPGYAEDKSGCGNNYAGVVAQSFSSGARVTSNSWGCPTCLGNYTVSAQTYDAMTRDASAGTPGNQQMLHIFAAGNRGGEGDNTVYSPGTAKNVLTVGATESVREDGVMDDCGRFDANSADDMAVFSSRGPTDDGRAKPDLVAPGTHIQSAASQHPGYNGLLTCGPYYPRNQTLYMWSSGTSLATPAVAGAASLVHEYYKRVLNPGKTPSPAMVKALLLNTPRYMTGVGGNGHLPSHAQGWGALDLRETFDGVPRHIADQQIKLAETGESYAFNGTVADPNLPVRVTLVWTDAPGSTAALGAWVNDIDLVVNVGSTRYKANNFEANWSYAGTRADYANNVESVFLPPGAVNASFSVHVIARNIAGDGVPGNGDLTDQDFALVVYNALGSFSPFRKVEPSGNHPHNGGPLLD